MDLYLLFANLTGPTKEPGKGNFDYKSTGWSSVAEVITLSYDMPKFCTSCVVYLAVYGFSKGSYSLQASSNGVIRLSSDKSVGDNVAQNTYNYYSYYNVDQFAEMSISLTTVSYSSSSFVYSLSDFIGILV